MSAPVKLTIICVFSEPHLIETTLTSIYELRDIPFELIIVNDGAGEDATSIIQSLSEYYDHDFTFFFEQKEQAGVGVRVNEVLQEVSGEFIWVVNSVGRINEPELFHVIQSLEQSEAVMCCLLKTIPKDLQEWVSVIHNSSEEERLGFIWKWAGLPGNQQFFDPYLYDSVAFELMWRLEQSPILLQKKAWFQAAVEEQENENWAVKREPALHWLRNYQLDKTLRERVYAIMEETEAEAFEQFRSQAESLLDKARQEKSKGNIVKALHFATQAHQEDPENQEIKVYYKELLELTGRFVEADEMKKKEFEQQKPEPVKAKIEHSSPKVDEQKKEEAKAEPEFITAVPKEEKADEATLEPPKYSIVIPTTGLGVQLMEQTFTTLANVIDREKTEIIVIDNASLDDTYDFLNEVKSQKVFRLEVITNKENKGFAFSVNQGIDKAQGEYILVMHNDIDFENDILYELEQVFNDKPDAGIVVPVLSFSMIPDQDKEESTVRKTDTLVAIPNMDSACFMLKKDDGFRMDEQFGLAYYDDVDLAFQVQQMEKKIYMITELIVEHNFASTTSQMGLSHQCAYSYLNLAKLYRKWGIEPQYEEKYNQLKYLDRCLYISSLMNPIDPEPHLFSLFKEYYTDEVKTEIVKTKWDVDEAVSIASMLIKTDQRDTLRRLENQLDEMKLPITLVQDIVRYYFERNIFSRCVHYLNSYGADPNFIDAHIYHLKILLGEKHIVEAAELVQKLLEVYPAHPELYKLTGDFHKFNGSDKESKDFYEYARQIDPFRFGKAAGKVSFI